MSSDNYAKILPGKILRMTGHELEQQEEDSKINVVIR